MSRFFIYCGGQTEETFVRDVLAPHLRTSGVYATAIIASTKRVKSGLKFKGGIVSYPRVRRELQGLLRSADVVTSMIDVYGLPDDFPDFDTRPRHAPQENVAHLEGALGRDLNDKRFIPHLSVHEFEAMLFVEPLITATTIQPGEPAGMQQLAAVAAVVASPEEINDGPETAPSKRILQFLPTYRKPLHGPLITSRIGLAAIRTACPHFAAWLTKLEGLG